jgi:UDP-N-acetylglucosamine--N-acetylmuramyl-(pentapeptide) pyrophosphoryl-undecaprenol N-acetylglucosamine transferase
VLGAGGFVQVPVCYAAKLLRIPIFIHQQDVVPTLANSLVAPMATKITTTFETSLRDFPSGSGLQSTTSQKVFWTGNPVRPGLDKVSREKAYKFFKLDPNLPTILITGGSSGAAGLNKLVWQSLPDLTKVGQVIHVTGRGKNRDIDQKNYHAYAFISEWELALIVSDLVITRAGVTIITELSALEKPSIIMPMPSTHQEKNATLLFERQAALVLDQTETTPTDLARAVRSLLEDQKLRQKFARNIKKIMPANSVQRIAKIISEKIIV